MIKNFLVRTLSGLILALLVIGSILWSSVSMVAIISIVAILSLREFYAMMCTERRVLTQTYAVVVGLATVLLSYGVATKYIPIEWLAVVIPALMLLFVFELWANRENPLCHIAELLSGIFYLAVPFAMAVALPFVGGDYNPWLLLAVIFTVWANDVGAYLVGICIGRHKIFPRVSPKKSWEGFFGGIVVAVSASLLMAWIWDYDMIIWGVLGLVIALASVVGDFVESMLKRSVGVKDSGAIIPGHGGILDRFDAFVMTIPFVFVYFIIFTF